DERRTQAVRPAAGAGLIEHRERRDAVEPVPHRGQRGVTVFSATPGNGGARTGSHAQGRTRNPTRTARPSAGYPRGSMYWRSPRLSTAPVSHSRLTSWNDARTSHST